MAGSARKTFVREGAFWNQGKCRQSLDDIVAAIDDGHDVVLYLDTVKESPTRDARTIFERIFHVSIIP